MTERPKNHFRRLIPYGLIWGWSTGIVLHLWQNGLSLGPGGAKYWIVLAVVWSSAGLLWAYLTSKFSKRKTNSEDLL